MKIFRIVSIALLAAFAFNAAHAGDIKLPQYQTLALDNGATVLLMPRKDVPLVAANIAVRGGARSFEVQRLVDPGFLVAIEAVAQLPEAPPIPAKGDRTDDAPGG